MKKTVFCLAVLICLVPISAHAEFITLNNGDQFSGQITGNVHNHLIVKTQYGILRLPNNDIISITQNEKQSTRQPQPANNIEPANSITIEPAPIKKVEDKFLNAKWSGRVNAGLSLQTGNSEQGNYKLDGLIKAKWDHQRASLQGEYNFEEDDGTTTVDNQSLKGIYDYFYTNQWFIDTSIQWKRDPIDLLDSRVNYGMGLGHQHYEQDNLNLRYVLGPSYITEDFSNGNSDESLAYNWALDYDQKFWSDSIQVFHGHELVVPADNTDAYLFDSKTGLRVPLKRGLLATAQIEFDWDNDPEPGTVEDDTIYSVKLGYEWGQ